MQIKTCVVLAIVLLMGLTGGTTLADSESFLTEVSESGLYTNIAASSIQSSIVIGGVLPLSGSPNPFGPPLQAAAQLAVDEVNAAGGIPGLGLVTFDVHDNAGSPEMSATVVSELINSQGIQAVFGDTSSSGTLAMSAETIPAGVFHISASATSPAISNLDDNDLVFRTAPPDSLQAVVLADLAFNVKGYRSIAIIARDDAFGVGLADVFKARFEAFGGTVTTVALFDPSSTNFANPIAEAASGSPDAIVPITFGELQTLISQMVNAGVTNFDLFVESFRNQTLITTIADEIGADLLEGIVGTSSALTTSDALDEFAAAYEAATGNPPSLFTQNSYDALAITMLAIARAGEYSGEAIAANLRSVSNAPGTEYTFGQLGEALAAAAAGEDINYQGVSGDIELNVDGDPSGPITIWTIESSLIMDAQTVNCGLAEDGSATCDSVN